MSTIQIRGMLLARNTAFNFIGQIVSGLVAFVSVPFIIGRLGLERFGVLSIAWVVLAYFTFFDLGLGRATTKFVAEMLGKGQTDRIPSVVWTSLVFILILSLVGTLVFVFLTPLLVGRVLNIPSGLLQETKLVFYLISVSVVVTLVSAALSGVLEAYQRFDLINIFKVPSNILTSIIPVLALVYGAGLPAIVFLLLLKNVLVLFAYLFACFKCLPQTKPFFAVDFKLLPPLFSFGGYVAVTNAAVMVLLCLDRFLVGTFLTMSDVTYYTVPYDFVNKALIIPSSMTAVLFPAFSCLEVVDSRQLRVVFNRALKYLIIAMGLSLGLVFIFSREILTIWLGEDFASEGSTVLRILAVGVILGSPAWLTGTLLQGTGRVSVVTTIHLIQVPFHILAAWFLIKLYGIEGAALSWTLRIALSLVLLLGACWKTVIFRPFGLLQRRWLKVLAILSLTVAMVIWGKSFVPVSFWYVLLLIIFSAITFATIVWKYAMNTEEKGFLRRAMNSSVVGGHKESLYAE